jgi:hypothetical protein
MNVSLKKVLGLMMNINPIKQYHNNQNSRNYAIKAKCAECVGCTSNHIEKGFRESISSCSSYSCPLYKFRPYQPKKSLEAEKTII